MLTSLVTALAFLATLGIVDALSTAMASDAAPTQASSSPSTQTAQADGLRALDGEWIYLEDRTEGRTLEQLGPPMSNAFTLSVEEGAVILVWGHGGQRRDVRVALDGSVTEIAESERSARYRGSWKDGTFEYQIEFVRGPDKAPDGLIRRDFRMTTDGLLVRSAYESTGSFESTLPFESVGLYRHAQDIPLPTPAKATIGDLFWLAGAWVGTRGEGGAISIEERWTPPLGGAMLAVSRTVKGGKMGAFEYLRIIEHDGGLVYIAQPGGAKPTEFVLTELGGTRAVFDNPRHDYPKRIVYELSAEGSLTATIGFTKGGTPRRFEFKREGN
ncbi:MAG: hypothetical protein KF724_11445 [Phycisphaeraceae bacterium]|nr:hypothetical protein [Phycisphaeraceae bacterium]